MVINFRQGIISAQTNNNFIQLVDGNVNINVDISTVDLAFAYGTHDYLFTESQQVLSAWSGLPSTQTAYLYWDIDLITGIRTYGFTVIAPSFGGEYPTSPLVNQHYFNYTTNKMYVWSGVVWQEKLRVFAGSVQNNAILTPNGLGSQVNLYGQVNLGYILFNSKNKPLRITDNSNIYYFITTEEEIHTQLDTDNAYKIDALLMDGRAIEPIPAFYCITWKGPKQTGVASYVDFTKPCIGISVEPSGVDQVKQFVTKGFVTNYINWNFTVPPNTPLFVGLNGQVTTTVPQQYSLQKIGHVVSSNTIFVDINEIVLIENLLPLASPTPTPSITPTPTPTPQPALVTASEFDRDASTYPLLNFSIYTGSLCGSSTLTDAPVISNISISWIVYDSYSPIITDHDSNCKPIYTVSTPSIAASGTYDIDMGSLTHNGTGLYQIYISGEGSPVNFISPGCGQTVIFTCTISTSLGNDTSEAYVVLNQCA